MDFSETVLNNKKKYLDSILSNVTLLKRVLADFAKGAVCEYELIRRPWEPGGGSTLFSLRVGSEKYFLKVKSSSVFVESKLEAEESFINIPSLRNEYLLLQQAKDVSPNIPKFFEYVEEDGFSFLFIENLSPFEDVVSDFNAKELLDSYGQIEGAARKLFEKGIVHTDIHENNIMFRGTIPVLIDFEEARVLEQEVPFEKSLDVVGENAWGNVGHIPQEGGFAAGYTCLNRLREVFEGLILSKLDAMVRECNFDSSCPFLNALDHGKDERIYQSIDIPGCSIEGQRPILDDRIGFLIAVAEKLFRAPFTHLDIGSNLGRFNIEIGRSAKVKKSVGVEAYPQYVQLAKVLAFLKKSSNVEFIEAECGKDSLVELLAGEKVDLVTVYSTYHHIKNKETFIKDIVLLDPSYLLFEMPVQPECYESKSWQAEIALIAQRMRMPYTYLLAHSKDYNRPIVLISKADVSAELLRTDDGSLSSHGASQPRATQEQPRVSVVLPTYNYLEFLPKALDSVFRQTFTDFELIIVNDGSTDGTKDYLNSLRDPRVRVIHQENRKLPGALNTGFQHARGEFLTWISSDNYLSPVFLQTFVSALQGNPHAGLAYSPFIHIDQNDNIIKITRSPDMDYRRLLFKFPGMASFMYRRCCQDKVGLYDASLEGAEDWDMWLRIAEHFELLYVPDVLYYYRHHRASMSWQIPDTIATSADTAFENAAARLRLDVLYPELRNVKDRKSAELYACLNFAAEIMQSKWSGTSAATRIMKKVFTQQPGSAEIANNLALAMGISGQWDQMGPAIAVMRRSNNQVVMNNLRLLEQARQIRNIELLKSVVIFKADENELALLKEDKHKQPDETAHNQCSGGQSAIQDQPKKSCIEYFYGSLKEFEKGKFESAYELMHQYRTTVDYRSLPRFINGKKAKDVDVSVVIVTYNRTDDVRKCIESVEKQQTPREKYEIIVVDNGLTDEQIIKPLCEQYIKCPANLWLSEGRNIGACFARGRIIAFLDDDALVDSDYIDSIEEAFNEYDIFGFRGKVLPKIGTEVNQRAVNYDLGDEPFPTYCNQEGNSAFLRDIFLDTNGMDPLLFGHEGNDLSYRIAQKYKMLNKVIYWPETVIYHDYGDGEKYNEKQNIYKHNHKYLSFKHGTDIFQQLEEVRKSNLPVKQKAIEKSNSLHLHLTQKNWLYKLPLYSSCFESVKHLRKVNSPKISVIVISWRRHPNTLENFKCLAKQRNHSFELIFVNNGCNEEEFRELEPYIDIYVRLNENTGAYLARNVGAVFASAPLLLFLEDDGIPAENIIEEYLKVYKQYKVIAARGPYLSRTKDINDLPRYYYLGDKPFPYFSCEEGNSSYRADEFFRIGGWDDDIRFGHGGVDLSYRLLKIEPDRRKQIYHPAPFIYHEHTEDAEILKEKRARQEQSYKRLEQKNPGFNLFMRSWDNYYHRSDLLIRKDKISEQKTQVSFRPRSSEADNIVSSLKREPRFSFVMIVLNGMPFIEYSLRSIYDFADEIIIVEGAVEKCMFAANPDGSSTDGTVEFIKSFPDPMGKIKLIQGQWPEKCEMQNEALKHVAGDYVWLIDSDEVYKGQDLEKIKNILKSDPSITQVNFIPDNFWKGLDYIFTSPKFFEPRNHYRRLFKYVPGAVFTTHRPPTMVWPRTDKTTEQMKLLNGTATRGMGIKIYHYSYVLDEQVKQKVELYHRYGWGQEWGVDLERWYDECFMKWRPWNREKIDARYPIWTGDKNSHTEEFKGTHPEVMAEFIKKQASSKAEADILPVIGAAYYQKKVLDSWRFVKIDKPVQNRNEQMLKNINSGQVFWNIHVALAFLADRLRPQSYLEVGVRTGCSLVPVVHNCDVKEVVAVDMWSGSYSGLQNTLEYTKNQIQRYKAAAGREFGINFIQGNSHIVLKELAKLGKKFDLITIDGDHSKAGAREDLQDAVNLLSGSGAIVFDDILNSSCPGLKDMVAEFRDKYPEFTVLMNSRQDNGCVIFLKNVDIDRLLAAPEARPLVKSRENNDGAKILIVRSDSIGDLVIFGGSFQYFRQLYSNSYITLVVADKAGDLAQVNPYIDKVITFNRDKIVSDQEYAGQFIRQIQAEEYDVAICPAHSRDKVSDFIVMNSGADERITTSGDTANLSAEHIEHNNKYFTKILPASEGVKLETFRNEEFLRQLGAKIEGEYTPVAWFTKDDIDFAESLLEQTNIQNPILLAPFAQSPIRDWRIEDWARLISNHRDIPVIICGLEADRLNADKIIALTDHPNVHNLCGKTSVRQLAALISKARLCVSSESAAAHLAAAAGCPHVVLTGGGHPGRFMPYSKLTKMVYKKMDCFGCNWKCKYGKDIKCIKAISFEMVEEALRSGLGIDVKPEVARLSEAESGNKTYEYLVSAIISTYNSEKFIGGCLEDLENQTIADKLEIIVVNSGSKQDEEAIVREFQEKYDNIVYIKTEQKEGVYSAWNRGVKAARGRFLTNANTDDQHRPDALEILSNELMNNPEIALVYGDQICTDTPNATFEKHNAVESHRQPDYTRERLLLGCCVGSQPMWRKSLHEEFGYFDEMLDCAGDWDFWLRISEKYNFKHIPEFLGLYYFNQKGIEHGNMFHSYYERYAVGKRYGTPYISTFETYHTGRNRLVSVILPAYNAEKYIRQAIESVLIQNYRHFELVIINDGSTDRTEEIIHSYKDEHIRYFKQANRGLSATHNEGIRQSRGEFLIKVDADDFIAVDFIGRHLNEFYEHRDVDMIYCDDYLVEEDGNPIRIINRPEYTDRRILVRDLFRSGFPVVPFRTCIRRHVFDKIGLFDETLRIGEDYDMMRRFVKAGLKAHHLKAALYYRRLASESLSRQYSIDKARAHFGIVKSYAETFSHDELFPGVKWEQIPSGARQLHFKCLVGMNFISLGQSYIEANLPSYAGAALESAGEQFRICLEIDPGNDKVKKLIDRCRYLEESLTDEVLVNA